MSAYINNNTHTMEPIFYDIVILGAGPAGLSLAAELSSKFSVLIVEPNEIGTSFSTWYSYRDRIYRHGLQSCIEFETNELIFDSYNNTHSMLDDCVVVNPQKILKHYADKAQSYGAIVTRAAYLKHVSKKANSYSEVSIREIPSGLEKQIYTKLVVDCMGAWSKIIKENKLIKRADSWVIYGWRLKLDKPCKSEDYAIRYCPANESIDEFNTYIGVHPHSLTEINLYAFQGRKNYTGIPVESLKPVFDAYVQKNYPNAKKIAPLVGCLSSGELKKQALDNVIFFGASGLITPESVGMGFNEILAKVKKQAEIIEAVLMENKQFNQKTLGNYQKQLAADPFVSYFQKMMALFCLHFTKHATGWDLGNKWLNAIGSDRSGKWMRNEADLAWLFSVSFCLIRTISLKDIVSVMPYRDTVEIFKIVGLMGYWLIVNNLKKYKIQLRSEANTTVKSSKTKV